MTHFFWVLLLECFLFCPVWAQVDYTLDSPYRKHQEGAVAWTLRATTKLHAAPDKEAFLHATVPVGTALRVLERLDEAEKRQGFYTNWYRVAYQGQEVFVWGGDLAMAQLQDAVSSIQITYGLQKISMVDYETYQEPQLELMVFASRGGQVLDSIPLQAIGTLYTQTQLQTKGHQGLAGVKQIVEIAFSDGYCGGVSATSTLLWDGSKWHALALLTQGFGDNSFVNHYYKYPQEHKKGNHLIELWKEEGYYNLYQQPIYTNQEKKWYEWTGEKLLSIEARD